MESELNIKENNNSNIILLKNKNPNFRNQKILIDNYSYFKNPSFYGPYNEYNPCSCFDLYTLNGVNDSIYIAYSKGRTLIISKYNYIPKELNEINIIENKEEIIK